MARRVSTTSRRNRRCWSRGPCRFDLVELAAQPDAIDFAIGREPADDHRDVVTLALAVDDIGEQERLAVFLRNAAAELPAHQRMHFRVLVDRAVDADELPGLFQRGDMIVQIGIGARRRFAHMELLVFVGDNRDCMVAQIAFLAAMVKSYVWTRAMPLCVTAPGPPPPRLRRGPLPRKRRRNREHQPSRLGVKLPRRRTSLRDCSTVAITRAMSTPTRLPCHFLTFPAMNTASTWPGFIRLTTVP